MKKGFTIAETVITMAVLGVIAAVVLPTMQKSQPNKDIVMYNKALLSIQSAIGPVVERTYEYAMQDNVSNYKANLFLANLSGARVCTEIANNLNTKGEINCNTDGTFDSPAFVTTDGLRFWNFGSTSSKFAGDDGIDWILVDYDLSNADKKRRVQESGNDAWNEKYGLTIAITNDGKVYTPNAGSNREFEYENKLIDNNNNLKVEDK